MGNQLRMWILGLNQSLTSEFCDLLESQIYFFEVITGNSLTTEQEGQMRQMPSIDNRIDSPEDIMRKAALLRDLYKRQ